MSRSPFVAAASLVARLVSEPYLIWLSLVVAFGVAAVLGYVMRHIIIGCGAKFLSIESERGVTAVEYGLIASLIALAIIVAVKLVGTNLGGLFNYIGGKVVTP
jgi:pilus assembly protein Flp/PilA